MWNVMVCNVITAVSGAIYPLIQKPPPDVGVVGGSQGGVNPSTPKVPSSQVIPPSQSSTVPGAASQAERPETRQRQLTKDQREGREARSASGSRARSRSRSEG